MKYLLLLALAAVLTSGCAPVLPHLAPTPALLKDERLDFDRALPAALKSTRLPVFFATTRAATTGPEHFGNDTAEGVTLGVARVRLGEPGWDWDALVRSDRASRVEDPRNSAVESVEVLGTAGRDAELSAGDRAFVQAIDE